MLSSRWLRAAALVAGLAAATALFTFPLAARAGSVGPVNTGDGQWSIWNVCWVARSLVTDPLHVFDANVFSPHTGTLAYSEANLAAGLLAVPAWVVTGNPYLAYNSAIYVAFLLTALFTYLLVRRLGGTPLASAAAAIAFAFAPAVIVRMAHVQLLMAFGLPLVLLALHRFVERPDVWRTAALAASLVVTALCTGYYGIAAGVMTGLGFVYYGIARGTWRSPRYLAACAAVILLAGLLVLPFFLPYIHLERSGAFRSIDETRRYSADWRSYLTSTAHAQNWLLGWAVPYDRTAFPERVLFPGFVATVLAAAALFAARKPGSPVRETAGFYGCLALLAAWLSFGPAAGLYRLAYELVPGFSLTRAPARLGLLVILSLSVLAGLALSRLASAARPRAAWAVPAVAALMAIEVLAVPIDLRPAIAVPQSYQVLATLPPGAVAEFPYFFLERDFYRNSLYMLHSTRHWHPLVNGYSDYIPDDFRKTVVSISTFPSREAFRLLRERGARYAVFHLNFYDHRSLPKLMDALDRYRDYLRLLSDDGDVRLYEVVAWP